MAFVLNNQPNLTVTKVGDDRRFKALLNKGWDLVIIPNWISQKCTARKAELARDLADCPVLILTWVADCSAPQTPAADFIMPFGATSAEILGRVQHMVRSVRGPKRGFHWVNGERVYPPEVA